MDLREKLLEQTGVEPDENWLLTGATGRTVQVWHNVTLDEKGRPVFWFVPGKDVKPTGDWMVYATAEKGIVAGVTSPMFREKAKKQENGAWALDMVSGLAPILYEFRRCAKCGGPGATHGLGVEWYHGHCR